MQYSMRVNIQQIKALTNSKILSEEGRRILKIRSRSAKEQIKKFRKFQNECAQKFPKISEHYKLMADELEIALAEALKKDENENNNVV